MGEESMKDSEKNLNKKLSLEIFQLLDQFLIILEKSVSIFTNVCWFSILVKFANNKKVRKTILKDSSRAFIEESDSNMFFDSQIEGTVAKLLSSKSKSRNFLGHWASNNNKQHHLHCKMVKIKFLCTGSSVLGTLSKNSLEEKVILSDQSKRGTKLMDLKFEQWEILDNSPDPDNYMLRCLEQKLRASCKRQIMGGSWSREERKFHMNVIKLKATKWEKRVHP